jgi:hypothetical protein
MWRASERPVCPKRNENDHKHLFEVPPCRIESNLPWAPHDRYGALYEAYKKHSAELRAIEDGENKLLLLMLTIFGAGITAVSKVDLKCQLVAAGYLTVVAGLLVVAGRHVVHENHDLRIVARDLLVRCEQAMQFYTPNVFLKDRALYQEAELHYACKGQGLQNFSQAVIYFAGGFLVALIWFNVWKGPIWK